MRDTINLHTEYVDEVEALGGRADARPRKTEARIDRHLVEAMLSGDSEAFKAIYLQSHRQLKKFLSLLLRNQDDAEEVVQDVFLYIWENRDKFDGEKNFEGLLYTIAKRQAFKLIRRRKLDEEFQRYKSHFAANSELQPDQAVMTDELLLLITLYIENLPPQRKRVFELSRIEGKSIAEIAEIMNLSPQTVKNYLQTAAKGLRKTIALLAPFLLP